MTYKEFLRSKVRMAERSGFDFSDEEISPFLKPHQRAAVKWMLAGGCRALFAAAEAELATPGLFDLEERNSGAREGIKPTAAPAPNRVSCHKKSKESFLTT